MLSYSLKNNLTLIILFKNMIRSQFFLLDVKLLVGKIVCSSVPDIYTFSSHNNWLLKRIGVLPECFCLGNGHIILENLIPNHKKCIPENTEHFFG